jgi:hypothetical protein
VEQSKSAGRNACATGKSREKQKAEEEPKRHDLSCPYSWGVGWVAELEVGQYRLVDLAVEDGGDLEDFGVEFGEFGGEDGLDAVGEGFIGLVVDFDEEAIAADGNGGAGERENFVAFAGAVAGIDHDGEMAALFDSGDNGEVEGVAGKIGEGAHAAFAEDDVVVAFAHNVFGGHQEFIEGGGHAAF